MLTPRLLALPTRVRANLSAWTFSLVAALLAMAIPTLALAQDEEAEAAATDVSFFQAFFISKDIIGQLIIGLLVLMSMFSIGFSIHLLIKYRRGTIIPEETREELETLIVDKRYREAIEFAGNDESYLGKLTSGALAEASNGYSAMERAVEETGDAEAVRMLRPIEYLNVMGNISPMIGLFGTVYGMILAFQQLVAEGGAADPAGLAGGISTALVTTFWGLVVAIPALAAYALIRNRVDSLTTDGLLIAEELIANFRPSKSKSRTTRATPKTD